MNERKSVTVHEYYEESENHKKDYSKEVFNYILKDTPFENHASDIFDKLLSIKFGTASLEEEERMKCNREYFQKQLDIAESLLLCKKNKDLGLCAGSRQSILPANIKEMIERKLEEEYRKAKLDYEPMTFEVGKTLLELKLFFKDEDVFGFIHDYWEQYADELGLTAEERAGGYDYDDITDEMIEMYIEGQEMTVEITEEQIKGKIASLDEAIKHNTPQRRGAPRKNLKLHCAISVFRDTGQYKPCNKIFRIIYKCLDFLEMIDEGQKKMWKTSITPNLEVSWIRQLCKEASKYQAEIYPF